VSPRDSRREKTGEERSDELLLRDSAKAGGASPRCVGLWLDVQPLGLAVDDAGLDDLEHLLVVVVQLLELDGEAGAVFFGEVGGAEDQLLQADGVLCLRELDLVEHLLEAFADVHFRLLVSVWGRCWACGAVVMSLTPRESSSFSWGALAGLLVGAATTTSSRCEAP